MEKKEWVIVRACWTYGNPQRPEDQWRLHPDVDGCEPTGTSGIR